MTRGYCHLIHKTKRRAQVLVCLQFFALSALGLSTSAHASEVNLKPAFNFEHLNLPGVRQFVNNSDYTDAVVAFDRGDYAGARLLLLSILDEYEDIDYEQDKDDYFLITKTYGFLGFIYLKWVDYNQSYLANHQVILHASTHLKIAREHGCISSRDNYEIAAYIQKNATTLFNEAAIIEDNEAARSLAIYLPR